MKQFQLSAALKVIYSLVWDDFCSWYLEWVKPGFEQPIDAAIYRKTVAFFDELLLILHPFIPFITEEIYHLLGNRTQDLTTVVSQESGAVNKEILEQGNLLKEVISTIRDARVRNQIKPKDTIKLHIQTENAAIYSSISVILSKQINAESIVFTTENVANTIVVAIEKDKFFIESEKQLDTAALKEELVKDLAYQKGFLESVMKKLGNERFVANAKPEVVAIEQKKKDDAEARIRTIEESLAAL